MDKTRNIVGFLFTRVDARHRVRNKIMLLQKSPPLGPEPIFLRWDIFPVKIPWVCISKLDYIGVNPQEHNAEQAKRKTEVHDNN